MNKYSLVKNYAEALADWHNNRSAKARTAADRYLAAFLERYGNTDMGVKVFRGADGTWEVDMTKAEAMCKTAQEVILAVKADLNKDEARIEDYLQEYGSGKWEDVEVDEEGDVGVTGEHIKGVLWLGDNRLETFLVWLNGQIHFPYLEAWAGGRSLR